MNYHFVVYGNPAIKKNGRNIVKNRRTGRMFPGKSKKLRAAERDMVEQLREKWDDTTPPIARKIAVKFLFYRATRHRADLSNLYEIAQDCLQAARIIEDDYFIESHDGSRRLHDPENPRTEITIKQFRK